MGKIFSFLLLCILLFTAMSASAGEKLSNAVEIFTITVTLLDLETRENDVPLLTVKLPNEEDTSLEAAEHCHFIGDRKETLSPADFGKRYKGQKVTIDFIEHGPDLYIVEECRAGTQ
jgi:hypothetical protein